MAINFKIYQSHRKGLTNGKYYARTTWREEYDLVKLANHMASHNTAFSRGQILAILTDIVACTLELCLDGKKVKFDNLGFFYISLKSWGAENVKDFKVNDNIYGVRVRYTPCGESSAALYRAQARVKEADVYADINKQPQPKP